MNTTNLISRFNICEIYEKWLLYKIIFCSSTLVCGKTHELMKATTDQFDWEPIPTQKKMLLFFFSTNEISTFYLNYRVVVTSILNIFYWHI